ncbi:MAG: bifunctional DNA primase/polymerase [Actinobacteria bacterium]|nr:bifunctional DNA primase/polymerase [Actinomycetota bacterium]
MSDARNGHSDGGEMDWTDAWRDAFRTELRAEAINFADHGWPVVPGSYPRGNHWVAMPPSLRTGAGQHGSVPVHPGWMHLAGCGPARVAELWSAHPFSVLLATGMGVDALDVSAELGRATAIGLRVVDVPVPIAATPTGRWLLPVLGGGALHHELAEHPDVVLHAHGSWVPLPPSPCLPGVVHWRVKPGMCGWQLPRLAEVTDAVLAALHEVRPLPAM